VWIAAKCGGRGLLHSKPLIELVNTPSCNNDRAQTFPQAASAIEPGLKRFLFKNYRLLTILDAGESETLPSRIKSTKSANKKSMSASLIGRLGQALSDYPRQQCRYRSRARPSLRNRHIGPSIMGSEDEVERSLGRPRRRQVQADMRAHLIHRPARDIIPPLGGTRVSS
jgi:hypothetical protein